MYTENHHSGESNYTSALVAAAAAPTALIIANPAIVAIHIQAHHPSIEDLLDVVQILRFAIRLAFGGARIAGGKTFAVVQSATSYEPAVVSAEGPDRVAATVVQLIDEIVRSRVDIVLNAGRANTIGIVGAIYLHQAGSWPSRIGITGRFLHGNDGQEDRVDSVLGSSALEVLIVLLAGLANCAVEFLHVDVKDVRQVQERGVPAAGSEASVEPVFRPFH